MINKKKIYFTTVYIALILFLIILFEIVLRLIGYGINTDLFVKAKFMDYYVENPYFINKYHPGFVKEVYSDEKNIFDLKKKKDEFRCFVIGGSTAQGYPFNSNQSFGKMTEIILNQIYKNDNHKVYNIGYSAMSSYYVRDAGIKALKYNPDALIIYSGHNEYYGTLGATTRGNYWTKNAYIFLKEFKIFQLILNTLRIEKSIDKTNKNLMGQLFANKLVESNDKYDNDVAKNFIKNINSVVKKYKKKRIPVIVIDPVSNYVDMPPFKGKDDEKYKELIYEFLGAINNNDKKEIMKYYKNCEDIKGNANIEYLKGLTNLLLNENEEDVIKDLKNAKDLDMVPFRARSEINEKLKNYFESYNAKYFNLFYIPLEENIYKEFGVLAFSNRYFIDHLHFNFNGNWLLSYYLVKKLLEIKGNKDFGFLSNYYNKYDLEMLKKQLHFTAIEELFVESSISSLSKKPPYDKMLIKYPSTSIISDNNEIFNNRDLLETINKEKDYRKVYDIVVNYYLGKKEYKKAIEYVESFVFINPGKYSSYYILGTIYEQIGDIEKAKYNYEVAYLLSNKRKDMKNKYAE